MSATVVHLHTHHAAKVRGIAAAVRHAALNYLRDPQAAAALARRATQRFERGACSPASAVSDAIALARRQARQGAA